MKFTKMQGLGNDFVVINGVNQVVSLSLQQRQRLADRHYGVGCDQLLIVEPATQDDVDFNYRIYNANGSEVEQCGNGARCVAKFIEQQGLLTNKTSYRLATKRNVIITELTADGNVCVAMGQPAFAPQEIPIKVEQQALSYQLDYQGNRLSFVAVNMGNPHAVLIVDDVDKALVAEIGSYIEKHTIFPEGVNVGFMQIISPKEINLRVYERHVGETKACGSGACAAVVAGIKQKLLAETVTVNLLGGKLKINWQADSQQPVMMTGPAEFVFSGEIEI